MIMVVPAYLTMHASLLSTFIQTRKQCSVIAHESHHLFKNQAVLDNNQDKKEFKIKTRQTTNATQDIRHIEEGGIAVSMIQNDCELDLGLDLDGDSSPTRINRLHE
jgi:hypothetical protein